MPSARYSSSSRRRGFRLASTASVISRGARLRASASVCPPNACGREQHDGNPGGNAERAQTSRSRDGRCHCSFSGRNTGHHDTVERRQNLIRRRWTLLRILLEAAHHDVRERRRDVGDFRRDRRRRFGDVRSDELRADARSANGCAPVEHLVRHARRTHRCRRGDRRAGSPTACSGAMYAGVPSDVPSCVSVRRRCVTASRADAVIAFAMPKSVTTPLPPESSTLSGLMSRCTTPCACAYASALRDVAQDARRPRDRAARRVAPGARAATRPRRTASCSTAAPSASPASAAGTMCGCCSRAASWISRLNRSTLNAARAAPAAAP